MPPLELAIPSKLSLLLPCNLQDLAGLAIIEGPLPEMYSTLIYTVIPCKPFLNGRNPSKVCGKCTVCRKFPKGVAPKALPRRQSRLYF